MNSDYPRQVPRQGKPTAALMHRQFTERVQDALLSELTGCTVGSHYNAGSFTRRTMRVYDHINDVVYFVEVSRSDK